MPTPEDIQRKKDFLALFAAPAGGEKPAKAVVVEQVKARLRTLAQGPEGLQKIDAMVEAMGPKAKTEESRAVLAEALKVRFNIETLSGDLSTKALPRLYHICKMVPEAHVRDNDKLLSIVRNSRKNKDGVAGWFRHVKTEGGLGFYKAPGQVEINVPKVGLPFYRKDGAGNRNVYEAFDFTTLHEIGHAVDEKLQFMSRAGATGTTGAWKEESVASVAAVGVEQKGLARDFPLVPAQSLRSYLSAVLEGDAPATAARGVLDRIKEARSAVTNSKSNRKDFVAAITRIVAINKKIAAAEGDDILELKKSRMSVWKDARGKVGARMAEVGAPYVTDTGKLDLDGLEAAIDEAIEEMEGAASPGVGADLADRVVAHGATAWAQSLRLRNSLTELWDDDDACAAAAVGGRVYQQAYAQVWVSYNLEARSKKLSGYQFRAPGEWFAELYACFYLRTPATHPHYRWFETLIDKGGFQPPAAPE